MVAAPDLFDVGRFCERFLALGHNGMIGLRYVSHRRGQIELELPGDAAADAEGAMVTLLDMAGTLAAWSRIGRFRAIATIDLRIDHLGPLPPGAVVGAVDCYHAEGALARVRGEARIAGRAVAGFAAAYMFTDG